MNWDVIGALAEILGAIGVVVTLVYLAIEVRHNRNATESASLDALTTGLNSLNESLMNDAELVELYLTGLSEPESLNEVQSVRFIAMGQSYLNHFTTVKKYHDSKLLHEEDWLSYLNEISKIMTTPGGQWLLDNARITPKVLREITGHNPEDQSRVWGVTKNEIQESA